MSTAQHFSQQEIKEQLNRVLLSPAFRSSRILSRFLDFVIGVTIAGKEEEIKEYSIGISVLSRNPDFNPQLDAIVRIHAGRLRRALKEYYYEMGKNDPIIIDIPKGSYIPLFHSRAKSSSKPTIADQTNASSRTKPFVAVLPFRNISKDSSRDFFADGLGEQLSNELTWFHELSVISYYSSRNVAGVTNDVREAATLLNASYLLTGSIQNDDTHLRIAVQLIFGDSGEQLWSKTFDRSNTASGLFEIQNEVVRSTLTAIGGYYGAIFRDVLKVNYDSLANGMESYDAVFCYYHFQKVWTGEVLAKTIQALENAVKADPEYALAWAILGELYLDDKALEFKRFDNPISEGLKCAMRAVTIDPNCQHAYQTLAWAYLFLHKKEECLKAIEKCISINPNASDMIGGMGFALTCLGEFEYGFELMTETIQKNPYCPWWFYSTFFFYYLQKKDYQQALHWVEKIDRTDLLWDPLLKAAVLGHLGRIEEAGEKLRLLNELLPDLDTQAHGVINAFLLSEKLKIELLKGLKKAGLGKPQRMEFK